MDETTALATSTTAITPPLGSPALVRPPQDIPQMTVVARDPASMMAAQGRLIAWAHAKLEDARTELTEFAENLDTAKVRKWKTSMLEKAVKRAGSRVTFYEKIKAALEAGYVIIPNMPVDVFAVRTTKAMPRHTEVAGHAHNVPDVPTDSAPAGMGEYVSSRPAVHERVHEVTNPQGHVVTRNVSSRPLHFDEVDFPFALAKPAILSATSEAMALRLFDDVAVVPGRPHAGAGVQRTVATVPDPMVVGRIVLSGTDKAVSFLVSWFVDTRDLP
jgi:hypothetical protein